MVEGVSLPERWVHHGPPSEGGPTAKAGGRNCRAWLSWPAWGAGPQPVRRPGTTGLSAALSSSSPPAFAPSAVRSTVRQECCIALKVVLLVDRWRSGGSILPLSFRLHSYIGPSFSLLMCRELAVEDEEYREYGSMLPGLPLADMTSMSQAIASSPTPAHSPRPPPALCGGFCPHKRVISLSRISHTVNPHTALQKPSVHICVWLHQKSDEWNTISS